MASPRVSPLLAVLLLIAGCKEQKPTSKPDAAVSVQDRGAPASGLLQPLDDRLFQLGGEIDVGNRYLPTLMITTAWAGGKKSRCGAVLLSPGVALTAGHCVCMPRLGSAPTDEGKTLIDTSTCAEVSTLRTVTYDPPKRGAEDIGSRVDVFQGRVRPHPELRIVLDARGNVVSSRGDLALILLEEPVKEALHLVLADTQVQVGESLVVVGYGYDELSEGRDGDRRASRNKVLRTPASHDDRLVLEQPERHLYKGDSGGPCLREGAQGPELVGVSSRNLANGATCTSIHPYREWLRAQLP